jgi:hypothetical protein
MTEQYRTVFEVSYFSNGTLFQSLFVLILCLSILLVARIIRGHMTPTELEATRKKFSSFRLIILACGSISGIWIIANICQGYKLTHALKEGRCAVVEGPVQVLRREPSTGHSENIIQIGDKRFDYTAWNEELPYHGGELLVDGIMARVHCLGNAILKVEIKKYDGSVP